MKDSLLEPSKDKEPKIITTDSSNSFFSTPISTTDTAKAFASAAISVIFLYNLGQSQQIFPTKQKNTNNITLSKNISNQDINLKKVNQQNTIQGNKFQQLNIGEINISIPDIKETEIISEDKNIFDSHKKTHNNMSKVTRHELDAKNEATLAKVNQKFAEIDANIDRRLTSIEIRFERLESKLENLSDKFENRFSTINQRLDTTDREIKEIKSISRNFKFWIIGTAFSLLIGAISIIFAGMGNVVSALSTGISIGNQKLSLQPIEKTNPTTNAPSKNNNIRR